MLSTQKTLARMMVVIETTTRNYLDKLLDFRLSNGERIVTATKIAWGKPGQSRTEYRFNRKCQVTHGPDPDPLDPSLVSPPPKSKNGDAGTKNLTKHRSKQHRFAPGHPCEATLT